MMQAFLYGSRYKGDETPDGKQAVGIVGDSNADGRGTSIPTVAADTLFLWNASGGTVDEITTQSVANSGGGIYGSIWQQYATARKSAFSKKTVIINGGSGGSEFYPNGDNNNWYTSGTLYDAWKAEVEECLDVLGLTKMKYIMVNLGLNDIRGVIAGSGVTIGNITTAIQSLVSRLQQDFPNTPIRFIQVGRDETTGNGQIFYQVRKAIRDVCETNVNCHITADASAFIGISGAYNTDPDDLHYAQSMNNTLGDQLERWEANAAAGYSKWANSIISCHYDSITTALKNKIQAFVNTLGADYFKMPFFVLLESSDINNFNLNWTFLGFCANQGATRGAVSGRLTTNGTTAQTFSPGYFNSYMDTGGAGQNDFRCGVWMHTRTTADGTAAVLFGRTDAGGDIIRVGQASGAGTVTYAANSAANSNGTDGDLVNDTLYSVGRNGTAKELYKGSTLNASATEATSGAVDQNINIGLNNNNGALSLPLNADYRLFFASPYSNFDFTNFVNACVTLLA